jgi:integrase
MLVMIFNYAARHRWVDFNPAEHVEKLRVPVSTDSSLLDSNILAPQELTALFDAATPSRRGHNGILITNNYRLLIKTAVFTGMRSGEIRGLRWADLDWNSKQLHIRRSFKEGAFHEPKTQASIRRIDLPALLLTELREWRLACPKGKDDLMFPNLAGNPMSSTNLLQRGFYPALRRAGLRKIRFHDLRHTFASLLIANGEDVVRVSRLLGHASPNITLNVYSHMLPKEHYGGADRLTELVFGKVAVDTASEGLVPTQKQTLRPRD